MDTGSIAEVMKATLSDDKSESDAAEDQLRKVCKTIGFAPSLLQIIVQNEMPLSVRQSTAIYLKNFIRKNWIENDLDDNVEGMEFSMHEQDRNWMRNHIVDSLFQPKMLNHQNIYIHIVTCIHRIIKCDFPERWPHIVDKIRSLLQMKDYNSWTGAILCLYQLVKKYEHEKADEREPLDEAMKILLPMIFDLMVNLMQAAEQSDECVLLQKNILKVYYTMIQFCLPLDLITKDVFTKWMVICRYVIERPVPVDPTDFEEVERLELPWWKAKKWAMHICMRTFQRYGSPGHEINWDYKQFSKWYLVTFPRDMLQSFLNILKSHCNNVYVSPRVITDILNYMKIAVLHAHSWAVLEAHMLPIIQKIIFPIMQYGEEDEDLYQNDQVDYIRKMFDNHDDYSTSVAAAQALFVSCCRIRKGILPKAMEFLIKVIRETPDPRKRDGALYMIGSIAKVLKKSRQYHDEIEQILTTIIFPEFESDHGHVRARAFWVLRSFCGVKFTNPNNLVEIIRLSANVLLTDTDLPVEVQAAIALGFYLLSTGSGNSKIVENAVQNVENITMKLLRIVRETEIDDVNTALQTIVVRFSEQLAPNVVTISKYLQEMFTNLMENPNVSDIKEETVRGLITTIEKVYGAFEKNPEIAAKLQPHVIAFIRLILEQQCTYFYEEVFSLMKHLTSKTISPDMWAMLEVVYKTFNESAFDGFYQLMPVLHNYVTIDTDAFLSSEKNVALIFDMCITVLSFDDDVVEAEYHAAKLIEVIILQCKGRIDHCIPNFVELAMKRLTEGGSHPNCEHMYLQILIAALYYDPILLIKCLEDHHNKEAVLSQFIKQWINDTDCFLGLHDRKLYVLGICRIISLGRDKAYVFAEMVDRILPSLLLIFKGLKQNYRSRAKEEEKEEYNAEVEDGEDGDAFEEPLSSDEDEIDMKNPSRLKNVKNFATKSASQAESIKDDEDDFDDSKLLDFDSDEKYSTPIDDNAVDEYIVFHRVITALQAQDPQYFALLTSKLGPNQREKLDEVIITALLKKEQYNSKQIHKRGGNASVFRKGMQ